MGNLTVPVSGTISGLTNNNDINTALAALATMVEGGTAPTTGSTGLSSLSGVWWHNTSNGTINLRNQADTAWIVVGYVDETNGLFYGPAVSVHTPNTTSENYFGSDRGSLYIRSNSGSAMSDTISVAAGFNMQLVNGDASATLTLTPTSGTIDGVSSITLSPGQGIHYAASGSAGYTTRGASSSGSAGAYVNRFRNGTMDVWQRGTSGTQAPAASVPVPGLCTADGWAVQCAGASVGWSQASGRALTRFSLKLTGATSVTGTTLVQRIESFLAAGLASQQVTIQAQVFNGTGGSITPTLTVKHATGVDNWSGSGTDVSAVSLQACPNSAWTQVSYSFTANASSGNGLEVTFGFGGALSAGTKTVQITELDIRVAPGVQTPELRAISAETVLCQRYFLGLVPGAANAPLAAGCIIGTTNCCGTFPYTWAGMIALPVLMRVAPSGVTFSNTAHFNLGSSLAFAHGSLTGVSLSASGINISPTLASQSVLTTTSSSGTIFVTGAEL